MSSYFLGGYDHDDLSDGHDQIVPASPTQTETVYESIPVSGEKVIVEPAYQDSCQPDEITDSLYARLEEHEKGEIMADGNDSGYGDTNDAETPTVEQSAPTEFTDNLSQLLQNEGKALFCTEENPITNETIWTAEPTAMDLLNAISGQTSRRSSSESESDAWSLSNASAGSYDINNLEEVSPNSDRFQEANWLAGLGTVERLQADAMYVTDFLFGPMDGNLVVKTDSVDLVELEMDTTEKKPVLEDHMDIGSTLHLPQFGELLGETQGSHSTKGDANNNSKNLNAMLNIPKVNKRKAPSVTDMESVYSDTSVEDSDEDDEDYVAPQAASKRRRRTAAEVARLQDPSLGKRSRRKSPKLWRFLLESLGDPQLNPSHICWENRRQGLFKIVDTKRLPQLWGSRLGKNKKAGEKHSMNYEKFSRAIRYYYKDQVLNSVAGRLTYQFGPNAIGWRQHAENASQ